MAVHDQPLVFISCVSSEFRQTRSRVAAILVGLGYTPVFHEIFGTEPGDLRQVLRDKIDRSEGLIQIVGQGYGAEPPEADADYGRVSYTQFEFLYARSQKKKPGSSSPVIRVAATYRGTASTFPTTQRIRTLPPTRQSVAPYSSLTATNSETTVTFTTMLPAISTSNSRSSGFPSEWAEAGALTSDDILLDGWGEPTPVSDLEIVGSYFEIYDIMTDDPSHNFVANGILCHNKTSDIKKVWDFGENSGL